ncbi:hypothetical protein [Aureimonas sp. AU22]|uniref:hypothetical protein n=1 Tax=Aureimonas sp. AU22 TaxID=1638162 RepID=UPI000784C906|nr:hypothetical protein [Aureimonas sp. AU22]
MHDDNFSDLTIEWESPSTWVPAIGNWVGDRLKSGGLERLTRKPRKQLYVDDAEWVDRVGRASVPGLEDLLDELSDDLAAARAVVFHGSRVDDPGRFSREGLKVNDPAALDDHVRELIRSEPELAAVYPDADALLASFPKRERDAGLLHVVLDSRSLTGGGAGHYLIYGSEWVQVILGWVAHPVLRKRGYPTLVRAVLNLDRSSDGERRDLARHLLLEWARLTATRDVWVQDIDFTFTLAEALPSGAVLGHTHPATIEDPFHGVRRRTKSRRCPACDP